MAPRQYPGPSLPPPFLTLADKIRDLEETVAQCRIQDVSYHVGKAKLAWLGAVVYQNAKQAGIGFFFISFLALRGPPSGQK